MSYRQDAAKVIIIFVIIKKLQKYFQNIFTPPLKYNKNISYWNSFTYIVGKYVYYPRSFVFRYK